MNRPSRLLPTRWVLPALLGSAAALLAGCEPSCEELAEEEAWLEIGQGMESFEPIEDGATLEAAWGSQGGQHFWSSLRTDGVHRGPLVGNDEALWSKRPSILFTVHSEELILASYETSHEALARRPLGEGERVGATAFIRLNPWDLPELFPEDYDPENYIDQETEQAAWNHAIDQALGRQWTFTATVEDFCGTQVSDSRSVSLAGLERW